MNLNHHNVSIKESLSSNDHSIHEDGIISENSGTTLLSAFRKVGFTSQSIVLNQDMAIPSTPKLKNQVENSSPTSSPSKRTNSQKSIETLYKDNFLKYANESDKLNISTLDNLLQLGQITSSDYYQCIYNIELVSEKKMAHPDLVHKFIKSPLFVKKRMCDDHPHHNEFLIIFNMYNSIMATQPEEMQRYFVSDLEEKRKILKANKILKEYFDNVSNLKNSSIKVSTKRIQPSESQVASNSVQKWIKHLDQQLDNYKFDDPMVLKYVCDNFNPQNFTIWNILNEKSQELRSDMDYIKSELNSLYLRLVSMERKEKLDLQESVSKKTKVEE